MLLWIVSEDPNVDNSRRSQWEKGYNRKRSWRGEGNKIQTLHPENRQPHLGGAGNNPPGNQAGRPTIRHPLAVGRSPYEGAGVNTPAGIFRGWCHLGKKSRPHTGPDVPDPNITPTSMSACWRSTGPVGVTPVEGAEQVSVHNFYGEGPTTTPHGRTPTNPPGIASLGPSGRRPKSPGRCMPVPHPRSVPGATRTCCQTPRQWRRCAQTDGAAASSSW